MKIDFDGTLKSLAVLYRTLPESPYYGVTPATQRHYDICTKLIEAELGHLIVADIRDRELLLTWLDRRILIGKRSMAVSLARMLGIIVGFGAPVMKENECQRLKSVLHKLVPRPVEAEKQAVSKSRLSCCAIKPMPGAWHQLRSSTPCSMTPTFGRENFSAAGGR
jgi:hypothetical protein